jgi:hypothetical protein
MSATLRDELAATSSLCAAVFAAWPDAIPRLAGQEETAPAPSANDLPLSVAWFPKATASGPAYGFQRHTVWERFSKALLRRREGEKDGPCFIPARFKLEPDGKHIRRLGTNLIARTAIVLDCETSKAGEVPPSPDAAAGRVRNAGLAGVVYTTHNHTPAEPRLRIVLALAGEIEHELPAVEVVADKLGLAQVIDRSKAGANGLFYLPSANPGELDRHQTVVIDGAPIDTAWIIEAARQQLLEHQVELDRIAAAAYAQAEARRQAKIAAGGDADDSLIEKIRASRDLGQILLSHGYAQRGAKFRHPNSTSGSYGCDIKAFDGVERVFSHNANDPLHRSNLPAWCDVTAVDAFDAVVILDFGGDRTRALRELAERYGITKVHERRTLARLFFRLIRKQADQNTIEATAWAEGARLGLTTTQVCEVARWVVTRATTGEAA